MHVGEQPGKCCTVRSHISRGRAPTDTVSHLPDLRTPQYIIMAIYARPLPVDPYNPSTSVGSRSAVDDVVRYPSPLIPIRIPVFALVIWLNDWIVRILSVGTSGGTPSSAYGGGGKPGARHRRVPSDSVESIEEGEAIELDSVSSRSGAPDTGRARVRAGGYGGNIGLGKGGRKYD